MFIEMVIRKSWEYETQRYQEVLNESLNMELERLYKDVKNEIKQHSVKGICKVEYSEVIIETMGCTYSHRNNEFCGCSMCDWDSLIIDLMAKMEALRKREVSLYAEAVRFSFINARGYQVNPNIVEEIAVHDAFSNWQMPIEVINRIFIEDPVYTKKPIVGILQARANSVNVERIAEWRQVFRKVMSVSIGVETSNEWIRNHWLNKNISNNQILDALKLLKEEGCNTSVNILLGIPGFTERQSIENFDETIGWLYGRKDVDLITVSPLVTRRKTLQGLIDKVVNSPEYEGNYTNPITIISQHMALLLVIKKYPGIEKKLVLSPPNCDSFFNQTKVHKDPMLDELEETMYKFLKPLISIGSGRKLKEITSSGFETLELYRKYSEYIDNQRGGQQIKEQLLDMSKLIIEELWNAEFEIYYAQFRNEVKSIY